MCLFVSHLYVFFGEMSVQVFSHFLTELFVFLVLSCMSCLDILEINPLSVVSFAIIFSYSEGKNIYFCFIDYAKAFNCVDQNKLWKLLKEMGIPDHLICLLRNLYAGQEATVRTGMEQQTGSKQEKEFVKAVYCHPVYLTSMQSTS